MFDGAERGQWATAGGGGFVVVDDRLESVPGDDLGLYWCTIPTPADFVLSLEWLRWRNEDVSGVFLRFPRPRASADGNPAFGAIYHGSEGAARRDRPARRHGDPPHRRVLRRAVPGPRPPVVRPPAEWNALEIAVRGQRYAVRLNGELTSELDNRDSSRGHASTSRVPSYIGLQSSPGSRVAFRRIGITVL